MKRFILPVVLLFLCLPLFADDDMNNSDFDDITAENIAATVSNTGGPNGSSAALITPTSSARTAPSGVTRPVSHRYRNAVGFEIGMPGRAIPGFSYTRYLKRNIFTSFFLGSLYEDHSLVCLAQAGGFMMINEFFYAGLGFSGSVDEDGATLFGIGNPSFGITARITEEIRAFFETDILLLRFSTNKNTGSDTIRIGSIMILKAGVKYFW